MTVQPMGAAGAAVTLTRAELRERGLAPEALTRAQALSLARHSCGLAGIPLGRRLALEVYAAQWGALILARSLRPARPPVPPPLRGRRAGRRPT